MADVTSITTLTNQMSNPFEGVGVELQGKWKTFREVIAYLTDSSGRRVKNDIGKGQEAYLKKFQQTLVKALASEGAYVGHKFVPHSPYYKSPTGVVGQRTRNYLNALNSLRVERQGLNARLIFSPGALNQKSVKKGLRLAQYAQVFEHGRVGQPARPIWKPTYLHLGGSRGVQAALLKTIRKRFNLLGI